MYHTILTYSSFHSFICVYGNLLLEFYEKNYDKVFATSLGGLGPLLNVNNTVIFVWHSKRKDHKNTVLTQFY